MLRISGFSTGLDIDSLVVDLMKAHRIPVDRVKQEKQQVEWQREQYREFSTKLVSLRNEKMFNQINTLTSLAKKAVVTGDQVGTVTATNQATGNPVVLQVDQVATAKKAFGQYTGGVDVKSTTTMSELGIADNSVTVNGTVINFTGTDDVATVLKKISSEAGAGVKATFDTASKSITVTNKETGALALNFSGDLFSTFNVAVDAASGVDAQYWINKDLGGPMVTSNSNKVDYDGYTINVNATGTATITATADTDKIVDTLKSFISDYNEVLTSLNSKLKEERHRKFLPLTEDQKKEMTETDIKLWEEKAKSGLLRNDIILSKAATDMRSATTALFGTGADQIDITSLGIETGQWFEGGKLILKDENKLRQAIEDDLDAVVNLFTARDTSDTSATSQTNGLMRRLTNVMDVALNDLANKAGTSMVSSDISFSFNADSQIGDMLRRLDQRIDNGLDKLVRLENQYYKQFTAMETAINRFNSQSASFAQMFQ
ncbi:flagellar filament capping protein FliD [Marinicrinis sediminis]|uniref:Flagellar hook-associated protein 2 n=1 Tax=Marinicrinis sediminis TaxID=1652465 RepID=A0ABW5RC66_9BACL